MKSMFCLLLGLSVVCVSVSSVCAAEIHLRGMKLLPGFKDQPAQGFDSIVGKIIKPGGMEIHYEIGSIPKPGGIQLGGQFSDRAKLTPKDQARWHVEQTVQGQPVHLAYRKDNQLLVSFPKLGMNFSVKIENQDQMAAALLMIMTYVEPAADKPADADPKE